MLKQFVFIKLRLPPTITPHCVLDVVYVPSSSILAYVHGSSGFLYAILMFHSPYFITKTSNFVLVSKWKYGAVTSSYNAQVWYARSLSSDACVGELKILQNIETDMEPRWFSQYRG